MCNSIGSGGAAPSLPGDLPLADAGQMTSRPATQSDRSKRGMTERMEETRLLRTACGVQNFPQVQGTVKKQDWTGSHFYPLSQPVLIYVIAATRRPPYESASFPVA